ncbi:MAG: response regulator [Myxococcota bacterium]|nr:response regulator [Myxococcota bacterium]
MRVLIADNSKTIRLRLGFLLGSIGDVEIIEAQGGQDALKYLTSDDPPKIALLAWMMQDLSGIEICKEIRKRTFSGDGVNVSPYIIIMTSKSRVEDIAEGLEAGADDYIEKPWNDIELKARLEVAKRSVALQNEFRRRYLELESLVRRYEVAHNVIAATPRSDALVADLVTEPRQTRSTSILSTVDSTLSLDKHLVSAFSKIGCGPAIVAKWGGTHPDPAPHMVWTASILEEAGIWMDFSAEIDPTALGLVHKRIEGQGDQVSSLPDDTLKTMVEIAQNEIRLALRRQKLNAWPIGNPVILTKHRAKLPPIDADYAELIKITLGDANIYIAVTDQESPVVSADVKSLESFDVVVEDLYSPWNETSVILKKGTSIRRFHINKLMDIAEHEDPPIRIKVMKPSPTGIFAAKIALIAGNI